MAPNKGRPRCFFDISIQDVHVGRIVFELFSEIAPRTCENFRALCTGEKGIGQTTGKPLHYKGTKIHRVVKDFIIQGGDFSAGNGTGGESIYGGTFADETFEVKHDQPFLLSMANRGKDTNGSQFFLTTKPAPHLDGLHVVFGHVISGEEVVTKMETQRTDSKNRPLVEVSITNCGELVLKVKAKEPKKKKKKVVSSSSSSDSDTSTSSVSESSELTPSSQVETESTDSEEERRRNRKKKKKMRMKIRKKRQREKRKLKKQKKLQQEQENEEGKAFSSEIAPNVTINPEEIPDIPAHNFLTRVPVEKKEDATNLQQQQQQYSNNQYRPMSRSGRKVKGRGNVRYRTPTRSFSRSPTPQYWKAEANREVERKRGWDIDATRRYITTGKTSSDDKWEKGTALKEEKWRRYSDRRYEESSPEESCSWQHEKRDERYRDDEYYDEYYDRSESYRKKRKKDKDKSKDRRSGRKRKHRSHRKSSSAEEQRDSYSENENKDHHTEENGGGDGNKNARDLDESPPPTHWKRGQKAWKGPVGATSDLYQGLAPPSKKSKQSEDIFSDRGRSPSKDNHRDRSRSRSGSSEGQSSRSLSASRKRNLEKRKKLENEEQKRKQRATWQPPEEDENIVVTVGSQTSLEKGEEHSSKDDVGSASSSRLVSYQERKDEEMDGTQLRGSPGEIRDSPEKIPDTPASPTSETEAIFDKTEVVLPVKKTIPIVIEKSRWERDEEASPGEDTQEKPREEPSKFIPLKEAEPVASTSSVPVAVSQPPTAVTAAVVPTSQVTPGDTVVPVRVVKEVPVPSVPAAPSQPKAEPRRVVELSKGSLGREISNQTKKTQRRLRQRSLSKSKSRSPHRYSISSSRSRSRSPAHHYGRGGHRDYRDYRSRAYREAYHSRSPRSRSRSYSRSRSRSYHRGRSRSHHREHSRSPRYSRRSYQRSRSRSRSYRSRSRSYSSRGSRSSRSRSRSHSRSRSRSRSRS